MCLYGKQKSRFDKPVLQPESRGDPSPISDKGMIAGQIRNEGINNMRVATPPPLTPESSLQSLQDGGPPPSLPAHPGNAVASSRGGQRSGNRWSNDMRGTLEQPQEYIPAPQDPTSLSYRLSNDKSRVRQHPGGSGRDEGDVEPPLSFQNAHAELGGREPEEMVFQQQQERPERPQVLRRGASLLDRLSGGKPRSHDSAAQQQSLRDRLIPSKRDYEDMTDEGMQHQHHDVSFDGEDGNELKRARRKNGRARTRGGRRGGPA